MLQPVGDLLIIERIETKESSILQTSINLNTKSLGIVKNKGRGIINKRSGLLTDNNINIGDIVVFEPLRGYNLLHNGINYLFISMNNIIAKIDKKDVEKFNNEIIFN